MAPRHEPPASLPRFHQRALPGDCHPQRSSWIRRTGQFPHDGDEAFPHQSCSISSPPQQAIPQQVEIFQHAIITLSISFFSYLLLYLYLGWLVLAGEENPFAATISAEDYDILIKPVAPDVLQADTVTMRRILRMKTRDDASKVQPLPPTKEETELSPVTVTRYEDALLIDIRRQHEVLRSNFGEPRSIGMEFLLIEDFPFSLSLNPRIWHGNRRQERPCVGM